MRQGRNSSEVMVDQARTWDIDVTVTKHERSEQKHPTCFGDLVGIGGHFQSEGL